jgi:uncharacterized protein (TIGR02145 family)
MKKNSFYFLLVGILILAIYSCSDDNTPGTSNNNNNGGGSNTGGCAGGPTTVIDIDGNVYNVVSIGNQCWMKENLRTTRYKNGTTIPTGLSDAQWQANTSGAYSVYKDSAQNDSVYGKLYNWYAVADTNGLCPTGWHAPEDWEWNVLAKAIDPNADTICNGCVQSLILGGAMKEIGLTHWASPNTGATNSSGFTGLPGGIRYGSGAYGYVGYYGYWWSATQFSSADAYYRYMDCSRSGVSRSSYEETYGFSVRCVRD